MYLLLTTLFLVLISSLLPKAIVNILSFLNGPTQKERDMHTELVDIRRQLSGLSLVDNFVAHAKLTRKFNAIENKLKEETNVRMAIGLKYKVMVTQVFNTIVTLFILITGWMYRSEPVVVLKDVNLFPLNFMLSYPLTEPGAISVHAWYCICKFVTNNVIN